eukprot:2561754-Pleurochrysis_carterae.AAC.2
MGERQVTAAQQAFAAGIRKEKVRLLLTVDTQRMVVKLGLQCEALADPAQILQRLRAALFVDTPQPAVGDILRRLSPEGTGDDSLVFRQNDDLAAARGTHGCGSQLRVEQARMVNSSTQL